MMILLGTQPSAYNMYITSLELYKSLLRVVLRMPFIRVESSIRNAREN